MKEEYNYTLTVPLSDTERAVEIMEELKQEYPRVRISRKPDTSTSARFYLCFPYDGARTDHRFQEWMEPKMSEGWDLFGPNYGVWGLK